MLGTVLIGVAAVVMLFLVVVALRPSAYHVERTLEIGALAEQVFGVLNDLHRFTGVLVLFGTPWEQSDPKMQSSFAGPATGVGQSYSWSGKKAGKGTWTIEESTPGQKVAMKLEFLAPMKSTAACVLTLTNAPAGSSVAWSMAGNHNFVGKAFGVFVNLNNMLGADIEKGLARLKAVVEGQAAAIPTPGSAQAGAVESAAAK
jgi:hypothetical protein